MPSEHGSWSRRFNRALRESRGITFDASEEKPRPDTMNSLIRDAAGRNRRVVDQDLADRGEEG